MDKITDHYEAFNFAFGIWTWLSHNHEGIRCEKYAYMSTMPSRHNMSNIPDIEVDNDDYDNNENYEAVMIYNMMTDDNWTEYTEEFERYMSEDWDNDSY